MFSPAHTDKLIMVKKITQQKSKALHNTHAIEAFETGFSTLVLKSTLDYDNNR